MKILFIANNFKRFGDGYDRNSIYKYLKRKHEVDVVDNYHKDISENYDLLFFIVGCGTSVDINLVKKSRVVDLPASVK